MAQEERLPSRPLLGAEHAEITARLVGALIAYVQPRGLGRVFCQMDFHLTWPQDYTGKPESALLTPNVSFFSNGRGPRPNAPKYNQIWTLAPDLAIEVATPRPHPRSETLSLARTREEMRQQGILYVRAGTCLVWIIYPHWHQVDVRRQEVVKSTGKVRWWWEIPLGQNHQLNGFDVLPGFTYSVRALFPKLDER